ncbi:MAG: GGDEF domain-containing protein, partial [Planctomycetota bacterium]
METLAYIVPWVFSSVCVGVVVGYFVGRSRSGEPQEDDKLAQVERQATLKVLVELLKSAEQISSDVECHNTEIQEAADHVGNMQVTGEMESVKRALLGHVTELMTANKRLQNDLTYSSYRMEEQALEIDHVRREARTDPLTGVSNRKAFDEKLQLLDACWRREGQPYTLILVDLDQFKRINDSHGHQAGDRVLEKVGTWLKGWVREGDFVGRLGGDEFAVLLPYTELEVAVELAETIRMRTADATSRIAVRGEQVSVSLSLGVATSREGDTVETVLHRADQALYKSKRRGRNQVNSQEPEQEETPAPTEAPVAECPTMAEADPS